MTGSPDGSTLITPTMMLGAATALLLAGCGDAGKSAHDCPDVRGSYSISASEVQGAQFHVAATFLDAGMRHSSGDPWQTITIEGKADQLLELTYARPRKSKEPPGDKSVPAYIRYALENPYNQPVETQKAVVQRGVHYECKRGWLVGPQTVNVRREAGGDLVGRMEIRQPRVFSLWAETGAGIPYWYDSSLRWSRWAAVRPSAAGQAASSQPMSRLEKQAHDLEYGSGAKAAARAAPYNVDKELRARVDRDAIVENIRSEGGRYVLTLRVESRGQLLRTLENLRNDPDMQDVQDHGVVSGGNRLDIATVSLRIVR